MGKIYYFVSAILFLLGIFILLAPALITPDLIYPDRIDSTYIVFHAQQLDDDLDTIPLTPRDVDLKYVDMTVVSDGIQLNGWFVQAADTPANTIIIIHDLNESRILYLDHMKQFHDRGLNVAVFDMRAHGSSGGTEFTPGLPAVNDVHLITDSVLAKKGTRHFVIYGSGIGSAIALQAAVYDDRCKGLILQNPFNTYENFIERYSRDRWGSMSRFWLPVFKRRVATLLHYPVSELDLRHIAAYTPIPVLFIIGTDDDKVSTSETLQVYDASVSDKKELFLVRKGNQDNIAKAGGEGFYNRITAFIVNAMPKEQKTSRYKKLALYEKK
jgi:alpha-beta hydrolase superfamily lysophospholipase